MSVRKHLADSLIDRITKTVSGSVTADMADIDRLIVFRSRSDLNIIQRVHIIFTAQKILVSHHLGACVVLDNSVFYTIFSLYSEPLLRSRRSLGE